ncbi:MAG: DNA-protecting protein DprA [Candidatus Vogelbacteria bacterium]|nr:DNA-protecting protein DprA [Candidatus Vogelbacteria bacterium]
MPNQIYIIKPSKFPRALLEIPRPPKELYIEGTIPDESYIFLTVVGSRKFSTYGKEVCEKLISGLQGEKVAIVSGLALGIDTIAHKSALDAGLKTVAVPGSGLDRKVLHPHTNKSLADEIVRCGGALLSELEPLQPAGIHTFPERNRIMAGLAKAILVIEAQERSGTIITARLATEYNRDLLAVPGSIMSLNSRGTNRLIKNGATPISSCDDLREALGLITKNNGKNLDLRELSVNEIKILELLSIEALTKDDLIRESEISTSEINVILSMMEIKGLIKELGGKIQRNT